MQHQTVKEKEKAGFEKMKSVFHYKNVMAMPKLQKIVLNVGTGTAVKKDKNKNETISGRLAKITGQKGALRGAKQSMYAFLEKLINIALPRTKDFRGISPSSVDNIGNLTIGIKEHTIFPETADEDIRDIFGLAVTMVCTAKNKKEGKAFFELLGVPFKKEENKKS